MAFWFCDFCAKQLSGEEGVIVKDAEVIEALKSGFSPYRFLQEAKRHPRFPFLEPLACYLLQFTETDWLLCEDCYDRFKEWQNKSKLQANLRLS